MATHEEFTLDLALAWIYTRDHQFVAAIDNAGHSPLAGAFAKFNETREIKYFPVIASVEESWRLLQGRIVTDQLIFRGVPFRRQAEKISTLSDLGIVGIGPPREIPRHLISDLVVEEGADGLILRLVSFAEDANRCWRSVEVEKDELFARFSKVPLKPIGKPKNTRKFNMIGRAIKAIWIDRNKNVFEDLMNTRISLIQGWIGKPENHNTAEEKKETVDERTIRRYFEALGE